MFAKVVILTLLVLAVVNAQLPCGPNNTCPDPTTQECNVATQECETKGGAGNCVDTFQGKGNCAQFKRKGFCDTGTLEAKRKYCAKTCNVC
uniref:ShKT domain-containing protein n=1 Tax=Steinernema glaseri TaxID=37863 RepID=A0A1I7ZHG1_9BILA